MSRAAFANRAAAAAMSTFVLLTAAADAGPITIINQRSLVYAQGTTSAQDETFRPWIPFETTITANPLGGSSSVMNVRHSGDDDGVTLEYHSAHARSAIGQAQSYARVEFVANYDSTYVITGEYGIDGDKYIDMFGYLGDVTTGERLLHEEQASLNTIDEHLILGGAGGDYFNYHYGDVTGRLVGGHTYIFNWLQQISPGGGTQNSATATGSVTMSIFRAPSSVPEPSSLVLLGTGVLGLAGYRSRRRTAFHSSNV